MLGILKIVNVFILLWMMTVGILWKVLNLV